MSAYNKVTDAIKNEILRIGHLDEESILLLKNFMYERGVILTWRFTEEETIMSFKYTQRGADSFKDNVFRVVCRGLKCIVRQMNIFFFPAFPKFVNVHEVLQAHGTSHSAMMYEAEHAGYQLVMVLKLDGSFVMLFAHGGVLHIYTMGSVNPHLKMQSNVEDSPTFQESVLALLSKTQKKHILNGDGRVTLCELVTPFNHIKTRYHSSGLFTLAEMEDGIAYESDFGEDVPEWPFYAENFDAMLSKVFNILESDHTRFGNNAEGVCVVGIHTITRERINLFKCKRKEYVNAPVYLNVGDNKDLCRIQRIVHIDDVASLHPVQAQARKLFDDYVESFGQNVALVNLWDNIKSGNLSSRKEMAIYIKNVKPMWMQQVFWTESDEDDLVMAIYALLHKDNNALLTKLQKKQNNHKWWEEEDPKQQKNSTLCVLFDFDDTIAKNTKPDIDYDDPMSLESANPITHMVKLMRSVNEAGHTVRIVTGRIVKLKPHIEKWCHKQNVYFDQVLCRQKEDHSVISSKRRYITQACRDFLRVVSLDDDERVGEIQFPNLTTVTIFDGVPVIRQKSGHTIGIVGPPGCGKTSILKRVREKLGEEEAIITGPDMYLSQGMDHKQAFAAMQKDIRGANGKTILVDTCFSKSDMFGIFSDLNTFTFMKMENVLTRGKGGKKNLVRTLCETQHNTWMERALARVKSNNMNGSTLVKDVKEVFASKLQGCLLQATNREVTLISGDSTEEYANVIIAHMKTRSLPLRGFYLALLTQFRNSHISLTFKEVHAIEHITIVPPSDHDGLREMMKHIGKTYLVQEFAPREHGGSQFMPVRLTPLFSGLFVPRYPHVTLSFQVGHVLDGLVHVDLDGETVVREYEASIIPLK